MAHCEYDIRSGSAPKEYVLLVQELLNQSFAFTQSKLNEHYHIIIMDEDMSLMVKNAHSANMH